MGPPGRMNALINIYANSGYEVTFTVTGLLNRIRQERHRWHRYTFGEEGLRPSEATRENGGRTGLA